MMKMKNYEEMEKHKKLQTWTYKDFITSIKFWSMVEKKLFKNLKEILRFNLWKKRSRKKENYKIIMP